MEITLIGLGYVGLPVACAFAKAGVTVYGVDKDIRLLSTLKERTYSYTEPKLNEILDEVLDKTLFVSDKITESDTYIITVQTPVNKDHSSDSTFVEKALTDISSYIKNGDLVILESTVPIGSNDMFYKHLYDKIGDKVDFSYCYCPESILPGNIFKEIEENSRVIGGVTHKDSKRAKEVYDIINKGRKDLVDVRTAEFVKLTQNAHRDVELAFVNQLSMMCDREGVDPFLVIELVNKHPRCRLLQPGSGVGGHCIAVDPYFFIERYGNEASLIRTAREVNDQKPLWAADKAIAASDCDISKTIGVLGLSYKADCEDCRESSGILICKYLKEKGYNVLANEVNTAELMISDIPNTELNEVIEKSNVIIIAQKHSEYLGLDYKGKIVIDCVGLWR